MTATRQMSKEEKDDKSSIEALLENFGTAHRASDPEAMLALYGVDPTYIPQNSPALIGRDAIRTYQEESYKMFKFDEYYAFNEIEVIGDIALARGTTGGKVRVLASGKEISGFGANTVFIFRREDGKWKIHLYTFNSLRPLELDMKTFGEI
jgi:uncharacterized protein (TIGR02246 family)